MSEVKARAGCGVDQRKWGLPVAVPPYPSICLGTFDASVFEMTASLLGICQPWPCGPNLLIYYVLKIKMETYLYSHTPKVVQAMNPQTAYVMTYMLKGVIDRTELARRLAMEI
jgi:penicillin-binding protein 1A